MFLHINYVVRVVWYNANVWKKAALFSPFSVDASEWYIQVGLWFGEVAMQWPGIYIISLKKGVACAHHPPPTEVWSK